MLLRDARILCFDVETTGLDASRDAIVEVAAATMRGGDISLAFSHLVDPLSPIPPTLTAIHGITDEMVRGQLRFEEIVPDLLDAVRGADVLCAYNIGFDFDFLESHVGEELWKAAVAAKPTLDPLPVARHASTIKGHPLFRLQNRSLSSVCGALGVQLVRGHRAGADCLAACAVLDKLMPLLPQDASEAFAEVERMRADWERTR